MKLLCINDWDLQQDDNLRMQVVYYICDPIYRKFEIDPQVPGKVNVQMIWGIPSESPLATAIALRWPTEVWYKDDTQDSPARLGTP